MQIPAFERLRQKDPKVKAGLDFMMRLSNKRNP